MKPDGFDQEYKRNYQLIYFYNRILHTPSYTDFTDEVPKYIKGQIRTSCNVDDPQVKIFDSMEKAEYYAWMILVQGGSILSLKVRNVE